jgi:sugar phosphate permease
MIQAVKPMALNEWRRGWPIAASASLAMGAGIGLYSMTSGLFVHPLQQSFGWSRTEIASAAVLVGLMGAVVLPIGGLAVDRFGSRIIGTLGMILYALSLASFSLISGQLIQYYLLGVVLAISCIFTGAVVFARPIGIWFERSRGLALGSAACGTSLIGALSYPALQYVIGRYGWAAGYLSLAAVAALAAPIIFVFMKDRPDDARRAVEAPAPAPAARLSMLVKDGRFWALLTAVIFANVTVGGLLSQLQPMLSDRGVAPATAAVIGSAYAISIAMGRVGGGIFLDRFWPPAVAAICMVLPIGGMVGLMAPHPQLMAVAAFVVLLGFGQGAEFDFLGFFISRYFGMRIFGTVMGVMMLFLSLAMSAGTFLFARIFDVTGSYTAALSIGIGANVAAAGAILVSGVLDRKLAYARSGRPQ